MSLSRVRGALVSVVGALCMTVTGCPPDYDPIVIDCAAPEFSDGVILPWAQWDQEGDNFVVAAYFDIDYAVENLRFAGEPEIEGAVARDVESELQSYMRLELVPDADAETIRVTLPLTCSVSALEVSYVLDISGLRADAGDIPVMRD